MKKFFAYIAAAALALCAPLRAASDYLLEIDGIEGEIAIPGTPASGIEIQSFSWGVSNTGSFASGGGGGAGKVSLQDFHFVCSSSKASPLLMKACATGQHIKQAILTCRKAGGGGEYIKITLTDVLVSSFQCAGSGGSDSLPTESISLNFAKIEFSYRPQTPAGLGDPVIGIVDLRAP